MAFDPQAIWIGPDGGARAVRLKSGPLFEAFHGIGEGSWRRAGRELGAARSDLARAYASVVWAYRCIKLRADAIAGVPLTLYDRGGAPIPDHPLVRLLKDVNPDVMNLGDLLRATEAAYNIWGVAYWLKVFSPYPSRRGDGAPGGARPVAPTGGNGSAGARPIRWLVWLNPQTVEPVTDPVRGIVAYKQTVGSQTRTFAPEELVVFRNFDPLDDLGGLSPLSVALSEVNAELNAARFVAAFFANDARPAGLLTTDQPLMDSEVERTRTWWQRLFGGAANKWKTGIVGGGLRWQTITFPPTDLALADLRAEDRRAICAAFGVPAALAGAWEAATYATAREQKASFYEDTILPQMGYLAEVMNWSLLAHYPDLVARGAYLAFDTDSIEALRESATDKAARLTKLFQAGLITRNEVRAGLGMTLLPEDGFVYTLTPRSPLPAGEGEDVGAQRAASATAEPVTESPNGAKAALPTLTDELARWERFAVRRMRAGKSLATRPFQSVIIPADAHGSIQAALENAETLQDIREVFRAQRPALTQPPVVPCSLPTVHCDAIKALLPVKAAPAADGDPWLLDVLGVPFGGPYGGKDAHGETFTPETDLWLDRIPKRPVVYYHGLADGGAPSVIGEELGWERRADGVWFRVRLDPTSALARRVWEAARQGLARASSGAIAHLVRVAADGRILVWPVGEISLLDARQHAPANPYAVAVPAPVHPYRVEFSAAKATFAAAGLIGAEAFEASPPAPAQRAEGPLPQQYGAVPRIALSAPQRGEEAGDSPSPQAAQPGSRGGAAGDLPSPQPAAAANPQTETSPSGGWRMGEGQGVRASAQALDEPHPRLGDLRSPATPPLHEWRGGRGVRPHAGATPTDPIKKTEDTDMTLDEQTLRNIMRQEITTALDDADLIGRFAASDGYPNAMFLTRQAPALIRERGEAPLTAHGTPFVDAVKAMRQGRFDVVRFQLSGKALAEGTDSAGGYLVPVEHSNKLIEMLRARTAVRAAGATVIPMGSDTLQIPSQTGGATAYWVAENAPITASDQTWGQVQLQAKKLAALTKLSAELFEDSDPQVEALVMADLARVLAIEEDLKYLRGDGAGNTPTGLEHISGVNVDTTTLGANGGSPTFDILVNMLYALDADNVPAEGRAWIVHPRTINSLRKVKDSQNKYLWADPAAPGDPPSLWGYPVFTTTSIPINETKGTSSDCSTIYLGAWPEFVIGQRKALELRASDAAGNAFEYDQVFIRAIMRVDCNVRHAGSFEVLKGVRP